MLFSLKQSVEFTYFTFHFIGPCTLIAHFEHTQVYSGPILEELISWKSKPLKLLNYKYCSNKCINCVVLLWKKGLSHASRVIWTTPTRFFSPTKVFFSRMFWWGNSDLNKGIHHKTVKLIILTSLALRCVYVPIFLPIHNYVSVCLLLFPILLWYTGFHIYADLSQDSAFTLTFSPWTASADFSLCSTLMNQDIQTLKCWKIFRQKYQVIFFRLMLP